MNKAHLSTTDTGLTVANDGSSSRTDGLVVQAWMSEQSSHRRLRPYVNANQQTSLSAMIAYISHRSGQSEYRIERSLSDQFKIPNAKCLAANDFDDAIRYLADIIP